jgi:hypothetical protein
MILRLSHDFMRKAHFKRSGIKALMCHFCRFWSWAIILKKTGEKAISIDRTQGIVSEVVA